MRIVINPEYIYYKNFIHNLPNEFSHLGEVIYKARNEVRLIEFECEKVVVKKFKVPHFINRIAYTFFRKSKAQRSYDNACKLSLLNIPTPNPIAFINQKKGGLLSESYYVCLKSEHNRMMREFWTGSILGKEKIIIEFARFTANLHNLGVYHIDYSPGNILFEEIGEKVEFSIIDINRMKFTQVSEEMGYKNFERLWINKDAYRLLAVEYAKSRGYLSEVAIAKILQYNRRFMNSRNIETS